MIDRNSRLTTLLLATAFALSCSGNGGGTGYDAMDSVSDLPDAAAEDSAGSIDVDLSGMNLEEALVAGASLLWVGAHPDDESLPGSMLYKACAVLGNRCRLLVLTHGEAGTCYLNDGCFSDDITEVRTAEMIAAAACYSADLEFLQYPNTAIKKIATIEAAWAAVGDPVESVALAIRDFKPDFVISFHPDNGFTGHMEHRVTGRVVEDALVLARDKDVTLNGLEAWDPVALYRVLNRYAPLENFFGLDPDVANETFDTSQPCGEGGTCMEENLRCFRLHESQYPVFGILMEGMSDTFTELYLERVSQPMP